jgi:uncharacterized membrane protein (DUF485 family)
MTEGFAGGAEGIEHRPDIDWEAVERSPEFRELIRRKKAFVIPATAFFLAWYFGFIILAGYAPDFMGREFITDGLTVGYALALSQFVMTWVLGWMYLRKADRVFDPLAERAREAALGTTAAATADTGAGTTDRRFRRGEIVDEPVTPSSTSEEVPRQ